MSILICGSLAYDVVMAFSDKLKLNCDPSSETPVTLYVTVPDMRRYFGGCAGNIAYNLKLLGRSASPMGTVGTDFGTYAAWLDKCGISREYIKTVDHNYTAQTYVSQDVDDNKIIAFHPGAMDFSHFNRIPSGEQKISLGVIAPDSPEGMRLHAHQLAENGIPMLFYPGITIFHMDGNELLAFIQQAQWVMVDSEQWEKMRELVGLSAEQVAERLRGLIINHGEDGALIYTPDACHQIPGRRAKVFHDATGADDAFCAGLLYGMVEDIDWETTGRVATLIWSIKVEHHGSQTHAFTLENFKALYKKVFGYALIT